MSPYYTNQHLEGEFYRIYKGKRLHVRRRDFYFSDFRSLCGYEVPIEYVQVVPVEKGATCKMCLKEIERRYHEKE